MIFLFSIAINFKSCKIYWREAFENLSPFLISVKVNVLLSFNDQEHTQNLKIQVFSLFPITMPLRRDNFNKFSQEKIKIIDWAICLFYFRYTLTNTLRCKPFQLINFFLFYPKFFIDISNLWIHCGLMSVSNKCPMKILLFQAWHIQSGFRLSMSVCCHENVGLRGFRCLLENIYD